MLLVCSLILKFSKLALHDVEPIRQLNKSQTYTVDKGYQLYTKRKARKQDEPKQQSTTSALTTN